MDDSVPVLTPTDPMWWVLVGLVVFVVGIVIAGYSSIPPDLEPPHYPSTSGQDYEALMCILGSPTMGFPERTRVLAGRAALRILIKRGVADSHGSSPGRER